MKKISFLTIVLMLGAGTSLLAQEEYNEVVNDDRTELTQADEIIIRPVHVSFITPLSTNGMQSGEVTNIFSFNMIAGYSGGLSGFEVGGFSNVIKGDTRGVQLAGFSNTNMGNVDALQAAGFSNVALGEVDGVQIAGFSNVARRDIRALQVAGFSNNSGKMILGGQFAGFSNVCIGTASGIQAAGFANVAAGMPVGGQLAGFANVNRGDANGAQLAGFANVNTGDINGFQASGFLNTARKVNGAQVGFINYADSIENGVALGFLSIVKHGYRTFEISANETFYGNLTFKTGIEKFYNIITIGASAKNNEVLYGWGYGIGTMMPVAKKMKVSVEAVSTHVNEDVWFTKRLNSLNKLNIAVEYKISEFLTVYGGPTMNVHVQHTFDVEGVPTSSSLVGWNVFDRTRNDVNVKMYPGFTVGIRL